MKPFRGEIFPVPLRLSNVDNKPKKEIPMNNQPIFGKIDSHGASLGYGKTIKDFSPEEFLVKFTTKRYGHYVLTGIPVPLARPRFSGTVVYDSQKSLRFAKAIELKAQHNHSWQFDGPLHMELVFYMPIAKSLSKTRRLAAEHTIHSKKPDLSNMIKFVEDVATDILFSDDALIASCRAFKLYSNDPRTELSIYEIDK
jgi:Holliday junction resolvase RusA-like endonuclease